MQPSGLIRMAGSGCLLPFLIIFNLFFGTFIFKSTRLWLGIEALLVLIFILRINIMARKISQQGRGFASNSKSHRKSKGSVIDIEGEAVEDEDKEGLK